MAGDPFDKRRGEAIIHGRSKGVANVIAFQGLVNERLQHAGSGDWAVARESCLKEAPRFGLSREVAIGILEQVAARILLSSEEGWEPLRSEVREIGGDPGPYVA